MNYSYAASRMRRWALYEIVLFVVLAIASFLGAIATQRFAVSAANAVICALVFSWVAVYRYRQAKALERYTTEVFSSGEDLTSELRNMLRQYDYTHCALIAFGALSVATIVGKVLFATGVLSYPVAVAFAILAGIDGCIIGAADAYWHGKLRGVLVRNSDEVKP